MGMETPLFLRPLASAGRTRLQHPKNNNHNSHSHNHNHNNRRDKNGDTSFLNAFFLSPTGVGRTRFLAAGVGRTPIAVPRWLMHVLLNRFLDQDTYLLATYILPAGTPIRQTAPLGMVHSNVQRRPWMAGHVHSAGWGLTAPNSAPNSATQGVST
jgi:hypothetical protein